MVFFSSELVVTLKKDHKKIRDFMDEVLDKKITTTLRQEAFKKMSSALKAHSKMEEQVVYEFVSRFPELKFLATVGTAEHRLIDRKVSEIEGGAYSEGWDENVMVLNELIDRHMNAEEEKVFPAINRRLDDVNDKKLHDRYLGSETDSELSNHKIDYGTSAKVPEVEDSGLVY